MSTPIETNTEELQEVLQQVYNLPNRSSGGSAEPDLVIGVNIANTKIWEDGTIDTSRNLTDMTKDDVSIINGSISSVVEKVKQGLPVKVLLNEIHFYGGASYWSKGTAEAAHVALVCHDTQYPNDGYDTLFTGFTVYDSPANYTHKSSLVIQFDINTGAPMFYSCSKMKYQ